MKKEDLIRLVFIGLLLALLVLSFFIVRPYIEAILAAGVLAYAFYPVQRFLVRKSNAPSISALLVSILIILVLIAPIVFVVDNATDEARFAYVRATQVLETGQITEGECKPAESAICQGLEKVGGFIKNPENKVYLLDALGKSASFVIGSVTSVLLALPSIAVNLFIMFFTTFYLLRDGHALLEKLKRLLPVSKTHQNHITAQLGEATYALIYGSLLIALIQGLLGALGLWVAGIGSPILWGVVMAVLALVPFLGTALVWGPAGAYLIISGVNTGETMLIYKGIGLLVYGALIVASADNILKPKIIGERAGIHPVLVLVGVMGGLATFGIIGFVIGPLVIALLQSMLAIYETETRHL